jgi:cation/acetate symporter
MAKFNFSITEFLRSISAITSTGADGVQVTRNFMTPGLLFKNPLDQISLGMALVFGTAGPAAHPHPLLHGAGCEDGPGECRLGHDPDRAVLHHDDVLRASARRACSGPITCRSRRDEHGLRRSSPRFLGGEVFFAFISAVRFATILAGVVAA